MIPRAVRLAPSRVCADCQCWPCRCQLGDGFEFPIRAERCPCGGPAIVAGGRLATVTAAINEHNATDAHRAWRRARQEDAHGTSEA